MSSISKRIEYSLRPNKAVPLDSRVHFSTLEEACKAINSNTPINSEEAELMSNREKIYYYGQLVTTNDGGCYQICQTGQSNLTTDETEKSIKDEINTNVKVTLTSSGIAVQVDITEGTYLKAYSESFFGSLTIDVLAKGLLKTDQIPSWVNVDVLTLKCTSTTMGATVITTSTYSLKYDTTYLKQVGGTSGSTTAGVSDVKINGTSVVTNKIANIDLTNYVDLTSEQEITGVKTFTKRPLYKGSDVVLPDNYTLLNYISAENSPNAYIDTGITAVAPVKWEIHFSFNTISRQGIIGTRTSSNRIWNIYYDQFEMGVGVDHEIATLLTNTLYRCIQDNTASGYKCYLNDNLVLSGTDVANISSNLFIGKTNNQLGGNSYPANANFYYCKIWQGDEAVREFVPCIDPDGVVGMYDLINSQFYSSPSDAFTAGTQNLITEFAVVSDIPTAGVGLKVSKGATQPQLNIDTDPDNALTINSNNQLKINIGSGLQITNNKLNLKIDKNSGLVVSSNDELQITIKGHVTGDNSTDTSNLIDNSYLYYKI